MRISRIFQGLRVAKLKQFAIVALSLTLLILLSNHALKKHTPHSKLASSSITLYKKKQALSSGSSHSVPFYFAYTPLSSHYIIAPAEFNSDNENEEDENGTFKQAIVNYRDYISFLSAFETERLFSFEFRNFDLPSIIPLFILHHSWKSFIV